MKDQLLGRCKECTNHIWSSHKIPGRDIYECPSCGYPHNVDDIFPALFGDYIRIGTEMYEAYEKVFTVFGENDINGTGTTRPTGILNDDTVDQMRYAANHIVVEGGKARIIEPNQDIVKIVGISGAGASTASLLNLMKPKEITISDNIKGCDMTQRIKNPWSSTVFGHIFGESGHESSQVIKDHWARLALEAYGIPQPAGNIETAKRIGIEIKNNPFISTEHIKEIKRSDKTYDRHVLGEWPGAEVQQIWFNEASEAMAQDMASFVNQPINDDTIDQLTQAMLNGEGLRKLGSYFKSKEFIKKMDSLDRINKKIDETKYCLNDYYNRLHHKSEWKRFIMYAFNEDGKARDELHRLMKQKYRLLK